MLGILVSWGNYFKIKSFMFFTAACICELTGGVTFEPKAYRFIYDTASLCDFVCQALFWLYISKGRELTGKLYCNLQSCNGF